MNDELVWHIREHTIPAALALLPGRMDSLEARAMLLATGLQESHFDARIQGGHGTTPGTGPARGFWQFERAGGVTEILTASTTAAIVEPICRMFLFDAKADIIHNAIAYHDTLACVFARLLLYRDPRPMPGQAEPEKAWDIYQRNWRPGAPRPQAWLGPTGSFATAWKVIVGELHALT